jgi:hypothetical protein
VEKESPSAIDELAREEAMRAFVGPSEAIQRSSPPRLWALARESRMTLPEP